MAGDFGACLWSRAVALAIVRHLTESGISETSDLHFRNLSSRLRNHSQAGREPSRGPGLLSDLEETVDLGHRRELHKGFGDALSRAFELAVTPAIFGVLGWLLDGKLGTRPLFMLAFGGFTICYLTWKQFRDYNAAMESEEAKLLGPRVAPAASAASAANGPAAGGEQ